MLLNSLTSIQNDRDLLGAIQNVMNSGNVGGSDGVLNPYIDIVDTKKNLHIYMEIPGVSESSIIVDFFNNKLSISGEKTKCYSIPATKNEISYGKFIRCITLPISVTNKDNVNVKYNNGVLAVTINKKKEEKNRFSVGVSNKDNEKSATDLFGSEGE